MKDRFILKIYLIHLLELILIIDLRKRSYTGDSLVISERVERQTLHP